MSYVVTARKWRPRLFRDVISQRHVTETLRNAITSDRVGHAYLFSGPRGVGKTTVARIFAKALNCVKGPAEEPCNECENCLSIQAGTSMDIQELDGASNNSVDDVRSLIANVGYHASRCRWKMYIIDEVHMLSLPAFNALLKTLEEPPPNVIFVFATTEPHKIPVTILSRCQRFDFHRLSVKDIAVKLRMIADSENIAVEDEPLMLIARRAGGAMRDAESILEQLKSTRGDAISVGDVIEVLGIADRAVYFDVIDRCHERDAYGAIKLFKAFYDEGGDVKEFVEGLLSHMRDLLYAVFDGGIEHVMLSDDLKKRVLEQAGWYGGGDLIRMIRVVTDVESSLAYAVLPVVRIETALARLASMERTVEIEELIARLGGAGGEAPVKKPDGPPVETERAPAAATIGGNPPETVPEAGGGTDREGLTVSPDIESIRDRWKSIAAGVGEKKPIIGPALVYAEPRSFENDTLVLAFDPDDSFHHKTIETNTGVLAEILGSMLGRTVAVTCTCEAQKKTNGRNGRPQKKKNELDDLIAREPIVGDILDRFNGEIIDTWRD